MHQISLSIVGTSTIRNSPYNLPLDKLNRLPKFLNTGHVLQPWVIFLAFFWVTAGFPIAFWSVSVRTRESIHWVLLPPIYKPYSLILLFCLFIQETWHSVGCSYSINAAKSRFKPFSDFTVAQENPTLHKHSLPSLIPNARHDFSPCRDSVCSHLLL